MLRFDFKEFKEEYKKLEVGESMSFFYVSSKAPRVFVERLKEEGQYVDVNYTFDTYPVLGGRAAQLLGKIPELEIPYPEFYSYAEHSGNLEPHPVNHPAVHALDTVLPRRSNRSFPSDTLPRLKDLHQVYITKLR